MCKLLRPQGHQKLIKSQVVQSRKPPSIVSLAAFHVLKEVLRHWKILTGQHEKPQKWAQPKRPVWAKRKRNTDKASEQQNPWSVYLSESDLGGYRCMGEGRMAQLSLEYKALSEERMAELQRKANRQGAAGRIANEVEESGQQGDIVIKTPWDAGDIESPVALQTVESLHQEKAWLKHQNAIWRTKHAVALGPDAEMPRQVVARIACQAGCCQEDLSAEEKLQLKSGHETLEVLVAPRAVAPPLGIQPLLMLSTDDGDNSFVFSSSYLKGPFQGEFVKCNGPQGPAEDLVLPFDVETRSRLLEDVDEDIEIADLFTEWCIAREDVGVHTAIYKLSYQVVGLGKYQVTAIHLLDVEQVKQEVAMQQLCKNAVMAANRSKKPHSERASRKQRKGRAKSSGKGKGKGKQIQKAPPARRPAKKPCELGSAAGDVILEESDGTTDPEQDEADSAEEQDNLDRRRELQAQALFPCPEFPGYYLRTQGETTIVLRDESAFGGENLLTEAGKLAYQYRGSVHPQSVQITCKGCDKTCKLWKNFKKPISQCAMVGWIAKAFGPQAPKSAARHQEMFEQIRASWDDD